jgi:hypothetical protein
LDVDEPEITIIRTGMYDFQLLGMTAGYRGGKLFED